MNYPPSLDTIPLLQKKQSKELDSCFQLLASNTTFRGSPPAGGQVAVKEMYFVYAIYNRPQNKIYIGQTASIDRRLEQHNQKQGNHFTAHLDGSWELIYKEEVAYRKAAIIRERQLKSFQGRQFIKSHIPR